MTRETERKRNKVNNGREMRTKLEEDRLSSLPDDIIHHILSFIDTKFVVQTCVLSSRWKLIWTVHPHLKSASFQFCNLPNFFKFVNRVLSCRNNSTEISTVDLYFEGRISQKFVEKIARYAFSHNVQTIEIHLDMLKGDHFPACLFGSESLEHLSLSTYFNHYNAFHCAQSPWNFPALTTLNLSFIWFCSDDTITLNLFSKCVNLKNLTLDSCFDRGSGVMQIFCPQLLNLTLKGAYNSKIELLTPNLTSFYYKSTRVLSLSTNGLLYLDTVNLEVSIHDSISKEYRQSEAHGLLCMLQELKDAKNLRVCVDIIEFLSTVPDILEHQPSPFSNLKCLTIKFDQSWKSMNSAMIDHMIKFLVNSSSSGNVIMEIPEKLSLSPRLRTYDVGAWIISQRSNWQELCKLAGILSSKEISDPRISQALVDLKNKLALQCQELGLSPPRWSN